ncbi:MAG: protein kinase, partial [Anaerolineales bacterium]
MLSSDSRIQGRYLVIDRIGQGGMGAVYRAFDERLKIQVALKQCSLSKPKFLAAFEQEARILASLRHPTLPRVTDHFSDESGQFLVMDFIDGDDLGEMLNVNKEPFAVQQVTQWADQILHALEFLHSRNPPVLHRDIKPQNLKPDAEGNIILLDFGLAKGLAPHHALQRVDLSGFTLQYAALEQLQGQATEQSDLYSLAATLYHLLTGEAPLDALTRFTKTQNKQPDPLRPLVDITPSVPEPLSSFVHQSMAIHTNQRPANARVARDALHAATRHDLILNFLRRFSTALREGYSIEQIFEEFANTAPEPTASEIGQILVDLRSGVPMQQALDNWLARMPSEDLNLIIA